MKEYYENTYQKDICCTIKKIETFDDHIEVYTDKTICYPECGGQPGDTGFLGPFEILDTKKAENGDSIHYLPLSSKLQVGEVETMVLNWEHRYKYMVMHTAQHLLSGLLFTTFNIGTVSVHLGDEYLTIETDQEHIDTSVISKLLQSANDKIAEAHKIKYYEMTHSEAEALGMRRSIKVEGDVRIVEIEGVDMIACGGIHVASTSELRLITYLGQQKIRDHVRLFFNCGNEALNQTFDNICLLHSLQNRLGCSTNKEIEPKVIKMTQQLEALDIKYRNICEKSAYSEIQSYLQNDIAAFKTDIELEAILKACEKFTDLALCAENEVYWLIVLKGRFLSIDEKVVREKILTPSGAKGGGRNGVYQGVCRTGILNLFKALVH